VHHNELPDEPLVAWVPINARAGGAADSDAPGNNITAMTTPIYTDEADPGKRLERIRDATSLSKEARSGLSARLMTDITRHVPAATQVMVSRLVLQTGLAARVCNLFVSNVPGPQFPVYMNGSKQVGSYGMAPLGDGMGLFIATPSYNGKMSFNVISTREVMPDIRFFVECLELSLNELLTLTATRKPRQKRGSSGARKRAASGGSTAKGKSPDTGKARAKAAGTKEKAATKQKTAPRKKTTVRKKTAAKGKTAVKTSAKKRGENRS
jgi:hypothetical protein